jgi:hypothetical protein
MAGDRAALGISSLFFERVFGFAGADTSVSLFVFEPA